jgi:hypothetical protein
MAHILGHTNIYVYSIYMAVFVTKCFLKNHNKKLEFPKVKLGAFKKVCRRNKI